MNRTEKKYYLDITTIGMIAFLLLFPFTPVSDGIYLIPYLSLLIIFGFCLMFVYKTDEEIEI